MPNEVYYGFVAVTVLLLLLIYLTMVGGGGKLTEARLVMIGLFVSIASVWYSMLSSGAHVNAQGMSLTIGGNPVAVLMRIGLILVLAGVGLFLHGRLSPPREAGHAG